MKRTKYFFLGGYFILLVHLNLSAQEGTDAAGGNATGVNGSVSYSIGQIDYISSTGTNGNVNQGLQQPYEFFTMGLENDLVQLDLTVYPNPATAYVTLKIDKTTFDNLSYELFDMNGRSLLSQKITDAITSIPLEQFPSATYFLKVSNAQQEIKTFKIIKK